MTRCIPACVVAFALAAVGVSAQYPEQKPADKMSGKTAQSVTITGCVREGDTPNSFVLANVDPNALSGHQGSSATGTAGTPSAPAASAAGAANTATVALISTGDIDLKKHVGHKVEVSGTIAPGKPESGAGTAGTPSADTAAKDKQAHKLNVRSVKHVSESCSM